MRRPRFLWPEYPGQSKWLIWKRVAISVWLRFRLFLMTPEQRALFETKLAERWVIEMARRHSPFFDTTPRKKWEGEPYPFTPRTSWKESGR
jgi:hypothetical protein